MVYFMSLGQYVEYNSPMHFCMKIFIIYCLCNELHIRELTCNWVLTRSQEIHPAWYWPLHHTHLPLLSAADWCPVSLSTQASWSLTRCGQGLFITSLSGGQLSQTPMVLACSSLMGSCYRSISVLIETRRYAICSLLVRTLELDTG